MGPADYALDWGDVGSAEGEAIGSFYFVVIAPGYENGGFADGAPGNLSDAFASAAPGDRGSGDTIADRTIVSSGSPPIWAPDSSGTHKVSFPPSNFEAIQLMPFDLTPGGHYVLAVCRTGAKASCDCAFENFSIAVADAGTPTPGTGGTSGSGGAPASGGSSGDAGTTGGSSQGGASNGAGGAPNAGGSSQSGSGGAAGCAGAAGLPASGGVNGSGGATSSGGASVDAGVPCITGSGGKAPSAGGASSDAGADCGVATKE